MATIDSGKTVNITDDMLKQYEDLGYMVFEQLFTDEEMDRIRGIVDELDEESERALLEKGQDFINIAGKINFNGNINFLRPELQRFIADQRFVEITTTILGPDTKLYWDQSVYKRPEADKDFPWHQDNGYAPTDPVHYVTCWLALADATLENGCIWIQPASHKKGYVTHIKTDLGWICYYGDIEGEPVELKKGSMVVFHSLLFHRSTPNRSNETRKGYVIQYSVDGARNPDTGLVYRNGPLIAKDGKSAYSDFVPRELC
jgi:phytanoyl-CoA hydroxylase